MQRGNGGRKWRAGIREGRMAESGAELEGRWAGGGDGEGQRVAGRAGAVWRQWRVVAGGEW